MPVLKAMFFDIGGTLGKIEPATLKLHIFADTVAMLHGARALGLRLGVITNVTDEVGKDRVKAILADAGIIDFFEGDACITSTDAKSLKPATAIYVYAAEAVHLPRDTCVYIDTNPVQVAGAIVAGMHGIRRITPGLLAAGSRA
jgi:FMN phosphatase YigB (HAD superfamily)